MAKKLSDAVKAAQARRAANASRRAFHMEKFTRQVADKITLTLKHRVGMTVEYLRGKVVYNISIPVVKMKGSSKVIRSKPGEFPRVETTSLMKSIFADVREFDNGRIEGYVGTPLDYGLILETSERLDRSYLRRTFNEQQDTILRMLTGPIT